MIKGFKEFILRGNVIDLAVAVVIGAAFTAIVNAIVQGFINPLIGFVFQIGDLTNLNLSVPTIFGGIATFEFGSILVAVINFLAVAAIVYFVFVFPMNRWKERAAARAGVTDAASEEPKLPTEQELLVQIRDLLERQNKA
ncbi:MULTISPECIES: large conductance mechanosensitive channel protein MscL [Microbacterium]|uniref:large conductance mechanosensitive channel protein MscL n=1 Tax=Microbacterium TaxID=33882 RepID=UPI000734638B|nr:MULTISPECIES: large conductance mechanosensitive channel protein MscL [Microbacterium]KTS07546.1 mechanosensitive ion channel protein MscL [Microbacterium testaceum]KTS60155.1 mechanosensitive ion channel protein MscL [Microbacterium testaceum]MDF2047553.1 large conductance mechanosensitive channel protein MscL [Microbacterium sp. Kw_RZR3]MDQ1076317.1 large conductance mechanosensitive channel [Microbacterium sp. SORGH_AS_0969]MDQ1116554.1 large conductance mechanosensitive channel [Microba